MLSAPRPKHSGAEIPALWGSQSSQDSKAAMSVGHDAMLTSDSETASAISLTLSST
jgi:hypothetical protein